MGSCPGVNVQITIITIRKPISSVETKAADFSIDLLWQQLNNNAFASAPVCRSPNGSSTFLAICDRQTPPSPKQKLHRIQFHSEITFLQMKYFRALYQPCILPWMMHARTVFNFAANNFLLTEKSCYFEIIYTIYKRFSVLYITTINVTV